MSQYRSIKLTMRQRHYFNNNASVRDALVPDVTELDIPIEEADLGIIQIKQVNGEVHVILDIAQLTDLEHRLMPDTVGSPEDVSQKLALDYIRRLRINLEGKLNPVEEEDVKFAIRSGFASGYLLALATIESVIKTKAVLDLLVPMDRETGLLFGERYVSDKPEEVKASNVVKVDFGKR